MAFLFLLILPLLVAIIGFVSLQTITWKEFAIQIAAQSLIAGVSTLIIYNMNTYDVEMHNGYVTDKKQVYVHCQHSYRCRCFTTCHGTGTRRSCSEHCSTCYRHNNDWNWEVYNSINETFYIDRIDSRGSIEPPRWTSVKQGDPTTSDYSYTNYIKAAPGTLFRHHGLVDKYKNLIPKYPEKIYDYYNLDRLVLVNGAKVGNPQEWNNALSHLNANIGARKEVNVVLVIARNLDPEYFYALEELWIGGKDNDVILVVGVDKNLKPTWARVMAWTKDERIKVKLRDDIMDLPKLELSSVMNTLQTDIEKYYKRKPMSDFEYLASSITPTVEEWVISLIIGFLASIGLTYMFHKNDAMGNNTGRYRRPPF